MLHATVDVSLESLQDLMKDAVESLPGATLIELLPEQALVGHHTNFASRAETTRFTFHDRGVDGVDVSASATNGLVVGSATPMPDAILETGRAVFDALVRLSRKCETGPDAERV